MLVTINDQDNFLLPVGSPHAYVVLLQIIQCWHCASQQLYTLLVLLMVNIPFLHIVVVQDHVCKLGMPRDPNTSLLLGQYLCQKLVWLIVDHILFEDTYHMCAAIIQNLHYCPVFVEFSLYLEDFGHLLKVFEVGFGELKFICAKETILASRLPNSLGF